MVRPRPPLARFCREPRVTRSTRIQLDGLRLPPSPHSPIARLHTLPPLFLGRSWRRERHLGPPEGDCVRRAARGPRAVRPRPKGHRPAVRRGVPSARAARPMDARRAAMEQGARACTRRFSSPHPVTLTSNPTRIRTPTRTLILNPTPTPTPTPTLHASPYPLPLPLPLLLPLPLPLPLSLTRTLLTLTLTPTRP